MLNRFLMASAVCAMLLSTAAYSQTKRNVPKIAARMNLSFTGAKMPGDSAIWVHPTKRGNSTIIATDSSANVIGVFDLEGKMIDSLRLPRPGDVDVRYNFPMGPGVNLDIITVLQQRNGNRLVVFTLDPKTRKLQRLDDGKIFTGTGSHGGCLYHSQITKKFYFFATHRDGKITQIELFHDGKGRISGKRHSKRLQTATTCRAAVADDFLGALYVSEKSNGVIKFDPEPTGDKTGTVVAKMGKNGLYKDVEGLALYHGFGGAGHVGYLVVSSQGSDRFLVLDRKTSKYEGSFVIRGSRDSRFISISSVDFGLWYTGGIMICNTTDSRKKTRILAVPWRSIAFGFKPRIGAFKSWDPRNPEKGAKK